VELWGFDGCSRVEQEADLLHRLRSERRGPDGAFILSHGGEESLWIHIHGDAAFLWYQPRRDCDHAGFVPDGMWTGERHHIRFLQINGTQADSILVDWSQLLTAEMAYQAAVEFLRATTRPESVTWLEL
jgi:hypothetical protein